jgi:outer membrane protein TolC
MTRALLALGVVLVALLAAGALHAQPAPSTPAPPATPAPTPSAPSTPPAAPPAAQPSPITLPPGEAPAPPPPTDLGELDPAAVRALEIEGLAVQTGGLTADETARRALAASTGVGQKRAELRMAEARIRQTTIEFFPRVGLRASYTRLSPVDTANFGSGALVGAGTAGPLTTGPCPMGGGTCVLDAAGDPVGASEAAFGFEYPEDNYALSATVSVPISDYLLRLSDAAASASASQEAARYSMLAEERKLQVDARALYYNWLRAHAQVSIAQNSFGRTRARLADARAVFEVGRLSNADLLRVEARAAQAELALQQAIALRTLVGAQLAIVMSDEGGGEYQVGQGLPEVPDVGPIDRASTQRLIAEALRNRLELKSVDASQRAMQRGQEAIRASAWPRLDAVGDFTYANPNPRIFPLAQDWNGTWSAGLVATFRLDDPFMSAARGDELAAQAEAERSRRTGVEALIINELVTAQLELVKAHAALRASAVSVRAAEEAYRVATELFRVGRGTTTDLLDAENELLGAKLASTNAQIDLAIAALRREYAIGPAE